jgi:hypothetical protein
MSSSSSANAATAGFRNAEWTLSGLPHGTQTGVFPLRTVDGAATNGFLYRRTATSIVVCIMHPREFLATHYMIPPLLEAGHAVFTQTPRSVGNDLRLEHESALLDVAAGIAFLRDAGYENVILLGNSGGSGLYCFYNQQSLLAPERRITHTPAGRPVPLASAHLPPVDGLILLSPHPGQGMLLMNGIDASVSDESDPFSVDPSLDPFSIENGFRPGPESSRYAPAFIVRYREAQRARVARLDADAIERVKDRTAARKRATSTGSRTDRARGAYQSIMTIWRTDADLRSWDLSLDSSERSYGSLWGTDPFTSNYGSVGFARLCTPESWLSTWSGLSSNASLERCAPAIEQPTLMVSYSGDQTLFPSDADAIFEAIGTSNKMRLAFRGNHHGQPLESGERAGREEAGVAISGWLSERFRA